MFYVSKSAGVNKFIDSYKLPQYVFACFVSVVFSLSKRPDVTSQIDGAELIFEGPRRFAQGVFVRGEDADDELNRFWVVKLPHSLLTPRHKGTKTPKK